MNKESKKIYEKLDVVDQTILFYLKEGMTQTEISEAFKKANHKPNSLSIIEKRLKSIKIKFEAKTNFHLAVIIYGI